MAKIVIRKKTSFPIYDELLLSSANIEPMNPRVMSETIDNMEKEIKEIIYAIILHHEKMSSGFAFGTFPYKGHTPFGSKNNGICFEISNFPPLLKKILTLLIFRVTDNGEKK